MPHYMIFFNQNWVGDHTAEWFMSRGPLARAVVKEMKEAGALVFAGGLEEDPEDGFHADATSGTLQINAGPYVRTPDFVGGLTIIDAPDDDAANVWAGKVAEACGWPQEVRRFKHDPQAGANPVD